MLKIHIKSQSPIKDCSRSICIYQFSGKNLFTPADSELFELVAN